MNAKRPKKRMLDIVEHGDKTKFYINYSSLDLIQTCKRKAYYSLERDLRHTGSSVAAPLLFGTAIHKALEVWYCTPRASRKPGTAQCDDLQYSYFKNINDPDQAAAHGLCPRCGAIYAFVKEAQALAELPSDDKRSLANGAAILNAYFDHYADDAYVVASDSLGPMIERTFETKLCDLDKGKTEIYYHGTIDVILQNEITGNLLVCDHKTTSSLGADFLNRLKPNFQYTGYVLGANRELGVKTSTFLVNGLQVAKTKRGFSRQMTDRTEDDFRELIDATVLTVLDYRRGLRTGHWPQTAPGPCSYYGGCQYREICETPMRLREPLIEGIYGNKDDDGQAE